MTSSVLRCAKVALKPLAITFSISAACSSIVLAQTTADQTLEPVLVTAARSAQKASDVLVDHVVITAEQIRESGQTSLVDLLQTKRSVEVKRNGGAGSDSEVYIRGGNGKQTILLIDGVRSVSSTSGTATWSAIPLSQIERVEIVMGPLGSLYGADAVSGVIQIFTKKGSGAPRATFSAGAGTYGEQVVTAGISGSVEGEHRVRYSINAAHEKAKGFSSRSIGKDVNSDDDGYSKRSMNGQFSWELAKGHEVGVSFLNSQNDGEYDATKFPLYNSRVISNVDTYAVYSRNQITDAWSSLVQLSRSESKQEQYESAKPELNNSKQDQLSWQNDIKLGADLLQVLLERREETVFNTTQAKQNRSRSNNSLALAYQLYRGDHLGSASVRYDNSSVYGSNVTGSLGYGYHLSKALRLSGSVGTSFRAPTYNDLYYAPNFGNPDVKPEKGKNTEIGIYYDDGHSDFSVAYYHNKITDLIEVQKPCADAALGTSCSSNVNKALLKGVSLSAGTRIADFRVYSTLDWQDPRDLTNNSLIARRARYHGTLGVSHTRGAFKSGADIIYSGYRFDGSKQTKQLGGYALLNLHASYDLSNDWQLFGRWNNALDKQYELAQGYQTAGSNIFVGVRYGFK